VRRGGSRSGAGARRLAAVLLVGTAGPLPAQTLLVPMDGAQANHLKAYGLVYETIGSGERAEWLLNYRAGSFLLPGLRAVERRAALLGVTVEPVSGSGLARLRAEIEASNMEAVHLEKAPRIAVYTPPNSSPWGDAVTLALDYAGIPYERVWDREVLAGALDRYDWLHLHHEDFTGQYSKFYLSYAGAVWLAEEVERNRSVAAELGFASVPALKAAVAERIRSYVASGGLLFAMCTATETLEHRAGRARDGHRGSVRRRDARRRPTRRSASTGAGRWPSRTRRCSSTPRRARSRTSTATR
jgi:hypothetical protein